ncbi:MAG: ATPase, T2SS/T4P/T4SS family [Acidobacteriaceae bacterium]
MTASPVVLPVIPRVSDFTDYLDQSPELYKQFQFLSHENAESLKAFDFDAGIVTEPSDQNGGPSRRIHACSCFRGKSWSLTVRQKRDDRHCDLNPAPAAGRATSFVADSEVGSAFLNSFRDLCNELYTLIFPSTDSRKTGIVLVTGGTGCGKSNVIRGLIDRYLTDTANTNIWLQADRLPHVVTYEDPIEKLLCDKNTPLTTRWLDYTPRQRTADVTDIKDAIRSALRQTPAVFYVGEVRDMKEWKSLLEFAGTGHLIFTTSHAGSLVEAVGKLFAATRSHTAARRAIIADRLVGLVHLRKGQVRLHSRDLDSTSLSSAGGPGSDDPHPLVKDVIVPSLWRRTMVGAKSLMSEGQSSLVPHTGTKSSRVPHTGTKLDEQSCFGRTYFGDALWTPAEERIAEAVSQWPSSKVSPAEMFRRRLHELCVQWDLEGL